MMVKDAELEKNLAKVLIAYIIIWGFGEHN